MKYLHTMVRVTDLDDSLDFYCNKLGLVELRRTEVPQGRFTLVFLAAPGDESAQVELTFNWVRRSTMAAGISDTWPMLLIISMQAASA
jgi:catechol 2,3-dioxygenase-like lactoylglutathione lyase family enzyme